VRWALEEAGLAYRTRLLARGDQDAPEYRALQPFGQVPIYEEDGRTLPEARRRALPDRSQCANGLGRNWMWTMLLLWVFSMNRIGSSP